MPKTQTFSDETFARRKTSEARLSIYPMLKSEELRERVIFLKFNKRSGSLEMVVVCLLCDVDWK